MNRIQAVLTAVTKAGSLSLATFEAEGVELRMIALELDDTMAAGAEVVLGVKPSHVSLAKGLCGEISTSNRLNAVIESIEEGALLCSVTLAVCGSRIESVITSASSQRMGLKAGERVIALIKASDLAIVEVCGG